jgi:hypothetical protein
MRSGPRMLKRFSAAFQFGIGIVHFFTNQDLTEWSDDEFRAAGQWCERGSDVDQICLGGSVGDNSFVETGSAELMCS